MIDLATIIWRVLESIATILAIVSFVTAFILYWRASRQLQQFEERISRQIATLDRITKNLEGIARGSSSATASLDVKKDKERA